jgi:hypothetical protein
VELDDMSMKDLLALHNKLAASPAGSKTFSTKAKLIARVASLQGAAADVSASADHQGKSSKPQQEHTVTEPPKEPKTRGRGVGELAKMLLMDPSGYPHALIAAMVNAQIEGATATAKSVRWYAAKMRKEGVEVPPRARHFAADLDEEQSKEYLKTVTVVKEGEQC